VNAEHLSARAGECLLLDVRHPHEWVAGHIPGSVHLPLDQLGIRLGEVATTRPVVVVCRSGPRSVQGAAFLQAQGFQVDHLEGGVIAWSEAGLPFVAQDGRAGRVVSPDLPHEGGLSVASRPLAGRVGLATAAMADLELAATVAATAEDLGYSTIWVADGQGGDGVATAAAMLKATNSIRVGVGPIAVAPGRSGDLLERLAGAPFPPERCALALAGLGSPGWTAPERESAFTGIREHLGPEWRLGVAALDQQTCRFAGEFADLVFLDWMNPARIEWARGHVARGSQRRAAGRAPVRVVARVHAVLGEGAALRLVTEALKYHTQPSYAASFAEMGSASVGIAAPGTPEAWALAEAFSAVVDELVIHPVIKLPTATSPTLGEVFYALSVLLEIAHAFAPEGHEERHPAIG
jgi:rhodanese-related sulfurtransferase